MASNLQLAFNQVALYALDITSSNTCKDLFPVENLISNNKSHWVTFTSSVTTNTFWFDLGTGNTQAADYFAFPAQYIDTANSYTVKLEGSNDNSIWSLVKSVTHTNLATGKTGYFNQDYITTFSTSTAFRYWNVKVTDETASNAFSGAFSKFFFGELFDMGSDPHDIRPTEISDNNRFTSDFGAKISQKGQENKHQFEITWNNVTDQKVIDFEALYYKQAKPLVYLYAATNNDFFNNNNLVSANILSYELNRRDNFNEITLLFSEAI